LAAVRFRAGARWLRDNAFILMVPGPLVLGGAAVILQPTLEAALAASAGATAFAPLAAAWLFLAILIARLSSTVRDVFGLTPSGQFLETLPVAALVRLVDVLVVRLAKTVALGVALVAVLSVARHELSNVNLIAGLCAALASIEIALALLLVRWGGLRSYELIAIGCLLAVVLGELGSYLVTIVSVATPLGAAFSAWAFARWRTDYRERARMALARAHRSPLLIDRAARRLLGAGAGALFVRDLRLVLRGFSAAPYLGLGCALALPALALWLTRDLDSTERRLAVEAAGVLSAYSLAAVTHPLMAYCSSRTWLEAVGTLEAQDYARSLRLLGCTLAAPSIAITLAAMMATGVDFQLATIARVLLLSYVTASTTALLSFEGEGRPLVSLVLGFLAACGVSLVFVVSPAGSPVWLVAVAAAVYGSSQLFERAGERAVRRLSA
jgi:hypothetical protein